jgi:PAS domain S-box-containing protein
MRIGGKFSLSIIILILVIGTASMGVYYFLEISEEEEMLASFASLAAPIFERSFDEYIHSGDVSHIGRVGGFLQGRIPLARVAVTDNEGNVRNATAWGGFGREMNLDVDDCEACHRQEKQGLILKGENVYRWMQPLPNRLECQGCHGTAARHNGLLFLDFDYGRLRENVREDILEGIAVFIPALIAIGLTAVLLSKRLVTDRVARLSRHIATFAESYEPLPLPPGGKDEIFDLVLGFNRMAEMIRSKDRAKDEILDMVRQQKELWQGTFDNITDLIAVLDGEFNIVQANRSFLSYFDMEPADLGRKKCFEVVSCRNSCPENCPHRASLARGLVVTEDVAFSSRNSLLRISSFPAAAEKGGDGTFILVCRDITEERAREARLIVSERMASLGQLASSVAHEINNPLASIGGCAEGLLARMGKDRYEKDFFEDYLKIIMEEVARCKRITSGVLSLVRKEGASLEEVPVKDLLERALELIALQRDFSGVRIVKEFADDAPVLWGAREEIHQILTAVIVNAFEAAGEKGSVTLRSRREGEKIFIEISDNGPGIPPDRQEEIFRHFFTTKSDRGAAGLGLTIARELVVAQGGDIRVRSAEGEGATFTLSFPSPS